MEPTRDRQVWQDVEVNLELALEFEPEALQRAHPGLVPVLAELLVGPPRAYRTLADLEPLAGLRSLEARHPRLRLAFGETRRVGLALDRLFEAIEFDVVGRRVTAVRPLGPSETPAGWRSAGVWLCHRPLAQAA